VLGKGTKMFVDLILGPNPRLRSMYMLDNGAKPGAAAMIDFYSFQFDQYDKDVKINRFTFNNYKFTIFGEHRRRNINSFRLGFDYEYFQFKQDISIDTTLDKYDEFSSYGTLFASVNSDTRNRTYFPTRGNRTTLRFEYVMPFLDNFASTLFSNSFIGYLKSDHSFPISKRFTLQPGIFLGFTLRGKDPPPIQHFFAMGGLNPANYIETHNPFTGVKFIQSFGLYSTILRLKLQYNVIRKIYLTLRADAGSNEYYFEDVWKSENILFGYGLTASYDSFIGPVELSLMASNINPKPILFLNLGFWF